MSILFSYRIEIFCFNKSIKSKKIVHISHRSIPEINGKNTRPSSFFSFYRKVKFVESWQFYQIKNHRAKKKKQRSKCSVFISPKIRLTRTRKKKKTNLTEGNHWEFQKMFRTMYYRTENERVSRDSVQKSEYFPPTGKVLISRDRKTQCANYLKRMEHSLFC